MGRTTSSMLLILTIFHLPIPLFSSTDTFLFGGCTQQKYARDSPYESNLNSLLASLVNSATREPYINNTVMSSSPQDVVYGLYQCRGDLSMPDCATCVARAVSQVGSLCPQTCGGAVQLQGCYVKYDNATFLGVEDKTVVLKKCGPSTVCDIATMNLRDTVLTGMTETGGPFRVGGSGQVQGLAQCVGDLSIGECQDCLSEAIGRLKTDCGMAVNGDLFLAKCYARYSTAGPDHDYLKAHDCKPDRARQQAQGTNNKSTNGAEKTFAIIIGLLAGIALFIIFLTFLRKVSQGTPTPKPPTTIPDSKPLHCNCVTTSRA